MEDLSNNQVNKNNKEEIIMNDNKEFIKEYIRYGEEMTEEEFIKEQEEGMAEMEESMKEYNKLVEGIERERKEGIAEMTEYNNHIKELEEEQEQLNRQEEINHYNRIIEEIKEMEQERKEGLEEMKEHNSKLDNQ